MTERWLPVLGHEGLYEVSDQGRVLGVKRGKLLKQERNRKGYPVVTLYGAQRKTHSVHKLVLEAFICPRPDGMQCLHANDIHDDNRLSNLRWGTPSENVYDKVRNGRHHEARKTHCKRGHTFTTENTYVFRGSRRCRACAVVRQRQYLAR